MVLWQDANADLHRQCPVSQREDVGGVSGEITATDSRRLSDEVVTYTDDALSLFVFSGRSAQLKISGSFGLCTLLSLLRCGIFDGP
jgi:hypothetical protein